MSSLYGRFQEGSHTDTSATLSDLGGYLGQKRFVPEAEGTSGEGDKEYILVKHINAVTVVAGHLACLDAVTTIFEVTNDRSAGTGRAAGLYVSVPAENEYCWLLIKGYYDGALTDGGVAAGDKLGAHATTDGGLDTVVSTTASTPPVTIGTAWETDVSTAVGLYVNSEIY